METLSTAVAAFSKGKQYHISKIRGFAIENPSFKLFGSSLLAGADFNFNTRVGTYAVTLTDKDQLYTFICVEEHEGELYFKCVFNNINE